MINKVIVTKDEFLFKKKVKVINPIYIEQFDEARPLLLIKNYTYILKNDIIDERVINAPFPILQWVQNCNQKEDWIIYLEDFSKTALLNSLKKKVPLEDAERLLKYCRNNKEIENEVYKYKHSPNYHYENIYKDEKEFCQWILLNKEIKTIPNYNVFYLTSILFYLVQSKEMKQLILEIEHNIKSGLVEKDFIEYLIINIRKGVKRGKVESKTS